MMPEFRLIKRFSARLKSEEQIQLCSYGVNNGPKREGHLKNHISDFSVSYKLYKSLDDSISLDSARCLVVSIAEGLLGEINSDKELRGELDVFPFSNDRLDISLYFVDKNDVQLGSGGISKIYFDRGEIEYFRYEIRKYTPPAPLGKSHLVHTESYEQALAIVKSQGCLKAL
jgi:hypothetical protein